MDALRPSPNTALILAVGLPPPLEALRLRHVGEANAGVPAHVTLLYPFAEPTALDDEVVEHVGAVVAAHEELSITLAAMGRWPDTLYATIEPAAEVVALHADLAAAFPSLPIYGGVDPAYVPHVTIVEGRGVGDPSVLEDRAWSELPVVRHVRSVELIVRTHGRWTVLRAFALGATVRR